VDAFDIITPIHSPVPTVNYDQQNTLPIGSCSLSDNRKTSAIKETHLQKKNIAQAFGVTSGPNTQSTSPVPMPEMSVTHTNTTGRIKVSYSASTSGSTGGDGCNLRIYLNGMPMGGAQRQHNLTIGNTISDSFVINVPAGINKIDLYWWVNTLGNTLLSISTERTLLVEEI